MAALLAVGAAVGLGGCDDLLAPAAPVAFTDLAVGAYHSCALSTAGHVWCWGRGVNGALGNGGLADRAYATPVVDGEGRRPVFARVAAGHGYTCALDEAGAVHCWGTAQRLVPGDRALVPARKEDGPPFVDLALGDGHACGLTADGEIHCWGANDHGQLGRGNFVSDPVTAPVATERIFTSVTAGGRHTCGLTEGGEPLCWGANEMSQLGNWSQLDSPWPETLGEEHRFTEIDAGFLNTCGLDGENHGWCWGAAADGQIGDYAYYPVRVPEPVPALVGGTVIEWTLVSIRAGHRVSCGVYSASRRQGACWGNGEFGQLGIGRTGDQGGPQLVILHPGHQNHAEALRFRFVDPGGVRHTCGLSMEGAVFCWGSGEHGQLGSEIDAWDFPLRVLTAR